MRGRYTEMGDTQGGGAIYIHIKGMETLEEREGERERKGEITIMYKVDRSEHTFIKKFYRREIFFI